MVSPRRVFAMILISTCGLGGSPSAASSPPLEFVESAYALRASGVVFEGRHYSSLGCSDETRKREVALGDSVFFERAYLGPLCEVKRSQGGSTTYGMHGLAQAMGWKGEGEYRRFPDSIYGLGRSRGELCMGTSGLGVVCLDLTTRTWSRYDVEDQPKPGRIVAVKYADDEFILASGCGGGGLQVFSRSHSRWLQVTGVPARWVKSLGYQPPSRWLSTSPEDHRVFDGAAMVPLLFDEVVLAEDGNYLLREQFSNGTVTEMVLSRELLRAAFRFAPFRSLRSSSPGPEGADPHTPK